MTETYTLSQALAWNAARTTEYAMLSNDCALEDRAS